MSLPIYQRVAVTDAGDVIPGAEYTVINENTGVAAPIYSDRTGVTLLTAPYFANSVGVIQFYIAQGTTYRVAASGGVGTYTDRYVYAFSNGLLIDENNNVTAPGELRVGTILAVDGTTTSEPSIPALDKRFATAWANIDGSGAVAIRDSINVSSVTDNGIGQYSVNFAIPMANANYAATCTPATGGYMGGADPLIASYCNITAVTDAGSFVDSNYMSVIVMSGQ